MTLDDAAAELVRARDAHRAAAAACEADWRAGRHTTADRFRAETGHIRPWTDQRHSLASLLFNRYR